MNGELKDFVLRKQDEHTKNLALFKTFERIRYFGKNVFIIGGIDEAFIDAENYEKNKSLERRNLDLTK